MTRATEVAGTYIGRNKVREGMETFLAPLERKRIAKGDELAQLDLREDGTFVHRSTTCGDYRVTDDRIYCKPSRFNGVTLEAMKKAAEQQGRAFGLAWLFEPFELRIIGEKLETADSRSLIYIEYRRKT